MNLTPQQLRVLVAVELEGSFTGAAERLHLTQSAVSRVVGQAERNLGTTVFRRTTRSLQITARGRMILPVARAMIDEFDRGTILLSEAARGEQETLTIAALPSVTSSILPKALAALRTTSPRTKIHIASADAARIDQLVREGAVDIAVTVEDVGPSKGFTPILKDEFVCLHGRDHPFSRTSRLTWQRVSDEPLIALSTSSSVRRQADIGFESAGARPNSVTETTDMPTAAALVAAGLGVTIATRLLLPLAAFADLAHSRLVEPAMSRTVGFIHVRPQGRTTASDLFLDALRTEGRSAT